MVVVVVVVVVVVGGGSSSSGSSSCVQRLGAGVKDCGECQRPRMRPSFANAKPMSRTYVTSCIRLRRLIRGPAPTPNKPLTSH